MDIRVHAADQNNLYFKRIGDEINLRDEDQLGRRRMPQVSYSLGLAWYAGSEVEFECSIFMLSDEDLFDATVDLAQHQEQLTSILNIYGFVRANWIVITEKILCTFRNFFNRHGYARKNTITVVDYGFLTDASINVVKSVLTCIREIDQRDLRYTYICGDIIFLVGQGLRAKVLFLYRDRRAVQHPYSPWGRFGSMFSKCLPQFPQRSFQVERTSFCNEEEYTLDHLDWHPFLLDQRRRQMMPFVVYTSIPKRMKDQAEEDRIRRVISDWDRKIPPTWRNNVGGTLLASTLQAGYPSHDWGSWFTSLRFMRNHVAHGWQDGVSVETFNEEVARVMPKFYDTLYDYTVACIENGERVYFF